MWAGSSSLVAQSQHLGKCKLLVHSETLLVLYVAYVHATFTQLAELILSAACKEETRKPSQVLLIQPPACRWTNGRYQSTLHRVVSTSCRERFSLPFFFEPSFDTQVVCLPSCSLSEPARYPPTTAGQHLLQKYAATHAAFNNGGDNADVGEISG
jgi:hypothetical protein